MADPSTERDPLEMLAADYMERLRQGQRPSVEEYTTQHPELAQEIRELFPTIVVTERLKARQGRSSDGRVTLGPTRLERLGDFRLIREIGRGGMGVVFEAEQESLGRRVAVKVLPRQVLLDEKHLKRFEREARIAANLHHTNIVEVFGVGEQDGFHYYVMQYIHGVGLDAVIPLLAKPIRGHDASRSAEPALAEAAARQLVGGKDGLSRDAHYWQSVARIGLQAADALAYAHSQGTLHRDIKPANLLVDSRGTIWLTDFGLAKAAQSDDLSLSSDVVGTLRYMAPEQFRGNTDHRSDIYSLGLTLYELLTLRAAYEEADHSRLIQRITQGPPSAPRSINPAVPRDLETIILKAINHDVSQRYQSARAMAEDLRCFLEDRPILARRVSPVEQASRWCRRNPALASLTGATVLLLVLVAVVTSIGYVRTKNALRGEAQARAKAEANAGLATEALDRIFERFSPARMLKGARSETIEVPSSPILSKEAAALLQEMLPFYDRLAQQTGNDDKLRARTADANRRVGNIRQRLGQFDMAVEAYRRAIRLYEGLQASSSSGSNSELEVAQIKNELGRLYTARRMSPEARESHLASLALLQADGTSPSAPVALRFELARTYYFLGTQERPLPSANPRQAGGSTPPPVEQRDSLAKAVALLKALPPPPSGNPEYQHLLALCYLEGAAVEDDRRQGDEHAIEILEGLVEAFPGISDYAYDLSEAYAKIHIPRPPILPETQKKIQERFGKALTLLEKLVSKHPDVPDFLVAEARMHHKLGSFNGQMEHWDNAEQNFRKAIAIQSPLVKQFPEVPYYGLWMATYRIALADALLRQNKSPEARTELEETISALLRQREEKLKTPALRDLLASGYSTLGVALRQVGETGLAEEAARKAEQELHSVRGSP